MTMDNNNLSQDEIDALLAVSDDDKDDSYKKDNEYNTEEKSDVTDYLSSIEADALGEIGNISIGSSATTLSTLLYQKVSITTPRISIIKKQELYESFSKEHVNVQVNYVEGFVGQNIFVVQSEDAAIISDIMLGGDGTDPDEELTGIHLSAIQEVMNQMMGSAATSMSTIFGKRVNISPPTIEYKDTEEKQVFVDQIDEKIFVKVSFQLKVGDLIDSNIMQLIPFPFAHDLVEELLESPDANIDESLSTRDGVEEEIEAGKETAAMVDEIDIPLEREHVYMDHSKESNKSSPQFIGHSFDESKVNVQEATFSNFENVELNTNEQRNLDILLDVPLKITVELGRTKRPIKDILDLTSGSIIELDKLAGEPVDILVNEKLIAKGEVVVIDENFGVRVTDIMSQSARIKTLQ